MEFISLLRVDKVLDLSHLKLTDSQETSSRGNFVSESFPCTDEKPDTEQREMHGPTLYYRMSSNTVLEALHYTVCAFTMLERDTGAALDGTGTHYSRLQVLTNLCCGKWKLSIIELKKTLEVDKDSLSRLGPQEPAQETDSDFSTACKWSCSYPVIFPPGPMDVLNMRLKSIGGERGLAVTGAVMENRVNMAASSSLL